jgi:hypothetical protein
VAEEEEDTGSIVVFLYHKLRPNYYPLIGEYREGTSSLRRRQQKAWASFNIFSLKAWISTKYKKVCRPCRRDVKNSIAASYNEDVRIRREISNSREATVYRREANNSRNSNSSMNASNSRYGSSSRYTRNSRKPETASKPARKERI